MFSNLPIIDYLKETSKISFPSPKGGSATALAGALAASLIQMTINLADKKAPNSTVNQDLERLKQQSQFIMQKLVNLIDEDAMAYHQVIQTHKREKEQAISPDHKNTLLSQKYLTATLTLCQIAHWSQELIGLIEKLYPMCPASGKGDLEIARNFAQAALKSALTGIKTNDNNITEKSDKVILHETLEKFKLKKQMR